MVRGSSKDGGGDAGAIDDRSADLDVRAFADEKRAEFDDGALVEVHVLDIELVAFLDAVLFTAGFDDCVGHGRVKGKSLSAGLRAGAESTTNRHAMQGFFDTFPKTLKFRAVCPRNLLFVRFKKSGPIIRESGIRFGLIHALLI